MVQWGGLLGAKHGILQAPLGPDISGPDLVAAVSNAGGFGFLRAPDQAGIAWGVFMGSYDATKDGHKGAAGVSYVGNRIMTTVAVLPRDPFLPFRSTPN